MSRPDFLLEMLLVLERHFPILRSALQKTSTSQAFSRAAMLGVSPQIAQSTGDINKALAGSD
jgi:hypothetical protein